MTEEEWQGRSDEARWMTRAAQWRQEHRSDAFNQRKLIVWEVDESEPWEGER